MPELLSTLFATAPAWPVWEFDPFLVRFPDWSPLPGIRWYGLAYVAGFVVAYLLLRLYFKCGRSPLNLDEQMTLMTAVIIGTLAGGRIGYMLLYTPEAILSDPLSIFRVWEGGMASHGGFIGIWLAVLWFSRKYRYPFWQMADITVTLAPAGILFGRIANFVNGELWGKVTDVPWAFIFPKSAPHITADFYYLIPPRHPSQLYEAFLEGLVLLIWLQARFWLTNPQTRTHGMIAGEFFMVYAVGRIISEVYREPDADLILGLSRGTFYSIIAFLVGLGMVLYVQWRRKQGTAEATD